MPTPVKGVEAGIVVRIHGWSRKFHIPADEHTAFCGVEASTVSGWTRRGNREQFEEICPERICKHCRNREQAA